MDCATNADGELPWRELVRHCLDRFEHVHVTPAGWLAHPLQPHAIEQAFGQSLAQAPGGAQLWSERLRSARSVRLVVPDGFAPVRAALIDAVLGFVTAFAPAACPIRGFVLPSHGYAPWRPESAPWPDHVVRLASWEIPIDTAPSCVRASRGSGARTNGEGDELVILIAHPLRVSRARTVDPHLRLAVFTEGSRGARLRLASRWHGPATDDPWTAHAEATLGVYETNTPAGYRIVVGSAYDAIEQVHSLLQERHGAVPELASAYIVLADDRPHYLSELVRYFSLTRPLHERRETWAGVTTSELARRTIIVGRVLPLRAEDRRIRDYVWPPPGAVQGRPADGSEAPWDRDPDEDAWFFSPRFRHPRVGGGSIRVSYSPYYETDWGFMTFPGADGNPDFWQRFIVASPCGAYWGAAPARQKKRLRGPFVDALANLATAGAPTSHDRPVVLLRGLAHADLVG